NNASISSRDSWSVSIRWPVRVRVSIMDNPSFSDKKDSFHGKESGMRACFARSGCGPTVHPNTSFHGLTGPDLKVVLCIQ
ncbi:hypothetical protein HMPREF9374_0991, partial [Desmospora sp. 8437]